KTYLSGSVKWLKPGQAADNPAWSKESGAGKVTFENATATDTTATFSAPGDYVLQLSAGEGKLRGAASLRVRGQKPPPADRLDVVYTKRYKLDSPFWNPRVKALIVNWIPHCIEQINRTNLTKGLGGIDNFVESAKALRGEAHARQKGAVFANAWVHQTVE